MPSKVKKSNSNLTANSNVNQSSNQQALQNALTNEDSKHTYSTFTTKNDYIAAVGSKSNEITMAQANAINNRSNKIIISNKKLIKEALSDFEIHNLILSPISGTPLWNFSGTCYNKSIGKSMNQSLLMQINNNLQTLTGTVNSMQGQISALQVQVNALQVQVNSIDKRLTKLEKEVKVLRKDVNQLKKDLADTKKRNNLK